MPFRDPKTQPIRNRKLVSSLTGGQAVAVVVRPERFELPTSWFVARHSIQLSYGRNSMTDHR